VYQHFATLVGSAAAAAGERGREWQAGHGRMRGRPPPRAGCAAYRAGHPAPPPPGL